MLRGQLEAAEAKVVVSRAEAEKGGGSEGAGRGMPADVEGLMARMAQRLGALEAEHRWGWCYNSVQ